MRKPVRVTFLDEEAMHLRVDLPRRRFTLIFFSLIFLSLFIGSFSLLKWQGDRAQMNLDSVKQQLVSLQKSLLARQDAWANFQDLEPRLKTLGKLLDNHMLPTRIFDALEQYTVADVFYSSFTLSPEGRLTLSTTAPSFESAAAQIVALRGAPMVRSVEAVGYQATYESDTGKLAAVNFQLTLIIEPNALRAALR